MKINIGFIIFYIVVMALSSSSFFFACLSHNRLNVIFFSFNIRQKLNVLKAESAHNVTIVEVQDGKIIEERKVTPTQLS